MGLGSWLSRFLERQLVGQFLKIELLVGLIGGLMPAALFAAHSLLPPGQLAAFRFLLYGLVLMVGALVGLEIPLVMRILKKKLSNRYGLKDLVSQVLTFDYLGALVVALAFPAAAGAASGPRSHGPVLWPAERAGGRVGAVDVSRGTAQLARPCLGLCADLGGARCRDGRRRSIDDLGRGSLLRRAHHRARDEQLSARRRDFRQRRDAAVPERQSAVRLEGRIPLSRGPGASGHGRPGCAEEGAGAGRRRWHGGARDPALSVGPARDAGGAGSAHDAALFDHAAACGT